MFTFLFVVVLQEDFSKYNGIKKITDLLAVHIEEKSSETNEKIIEVILSIAGNCTCKSENCADQVNFLQASLKIGCTWLERN